MSLDQLTTEILLNIGFYVDHEDLRELCLTSRRLMLIFEEKAYEVAEFDETSESANGLFALASGPRGNIVRKIRYKPHSPWPAEDEDEDEVKEHNPDIKLSDETRRALQSLDLFPSVEKFQFDLTDWNLDGWLDASLNYDSDGDHGSCNTEPWKVLVEQSLQSLIKSAGTFSQLELNGLPPDVHESYLFWQSDDWRSLGSLKSFEISLGGVEDSGNGSMTGFHQDFVALIPDMFLKHLTHVQLLRVAGTEDAVIGTNENTEPIDWTSLQLPCLTSFEMDYSQISDGHIEFFSNHAAKLERISLRNCIATLKEVWSNLFRLFLDKKPAQLVDFTVVAYPVRMRMGQPNYWSMGNIAGFDMSDELKKEKMRRFVVGEACDRYGTIDPVEDRAESDDDAQLDESDVVEWWTELEGLLERNRKQAGLAREKQVTLDRGLPMDNCDRLID
ncbi:hypothetical protein FSARC_10773 [Fusarium sarcochroum]|uniref:F-box domain-containing protein n=1 Tax=Fusarium sarcochroum TaxID=1208366 RepID=A0A8H4TJZ1_9HYPO|nr:hypothetical protein FSARC_10773 [Fusarium sarcochroum]